MNVSGNGGLDRYYHVSGKERKASPDILSVHTSKLLPPILIPSFRISNPLPALSE